MSITVKDYINKVKMVRENILDEQEKSILRNENQIANLNISQIEDSSGSDGKLLQNKNKIFTGLYSMSTQLINPKKVAGTPYDFLETGTFLSNFQVDISNDLSKLSIFSTGTGSGDKAEFFRGYTNLFGLNTNNANKLNYEIILPDLQKYIKQYL